MNKQSELRIRLDSDKYDKLIAIANELDMTTYALIRKLVDYTIYEYGQSQGGDRSEWQGLQRSGKQPH